MAATTLSTTDQVLIKQIIIETAFGVGLWGINTTFFVMSTFTLFKQGIRTSRARQVLLAVTSLMYIGASAFEIDYLLIFLNDIKQLGALPHPVALQPNATFYVSIIFSRINYLLSDGVVCWRAWVLYPHSKPVQGLLIFCMLGSGAAVLTDAILGTERLLKGIVDMGISLFNLDLYLPLLLTNVVATVLVGYKFWQYRQEIKEHFYKPRQKTQVGSILVLLTESGLLYCFFWIIAMFSGVNIVGQLCAVIFECALPQLSAMYLMTVVLVVSLQRSLDMDSVFSMQSEGMNPIGSMVFAHPAPMATNSSFDTSMKEGPHIGYSFVKRVKDVSQWKVDVEGLPGDSQSSIVESNRVRSNSVGATQLV
ncbi:hypothetical protein BT96DRAFT_918253 [Gymnopus androsaceus JB14]|uniref:Family A G protein-coupled receptor-like protein n=1 Tax=Gymnopus androsaceus JB14 TaxID=1447944 RepID=A0A6A4HXF8_9AGAR|nr:hypothetical protein BT96DRAFT_918253 [Gymnopus androsaceus JB14]